MNVGLEGQGGAPPAAVRSAERRSPRTAAGLHTGVTSVVIKGLADHRDSLGAPLCPCRHYDDKAAEVGQGFWNCPRVPMRERPDGPGLPICH
ncbi:hypothetical protein J5N97_021462 [Dioscorea zingiberensis]|uniref:Ferredoxin-thioredoxin reductase catalytic chain, chloroplastic n=1 Tax=Dioscorea zingiberensis TaxID=325984 RepID=A0A9D5HEM6_9LILI|nr:hypothetical protein J5N97_021462 [Dioscorea zingiberensis]